MSIYIFQYEQVIANNNDCDWLKDNFFERIPV